jgi:CheY-like chemotaxis protein
MKSILVIEDHQEVMENIGEILELAGYDVHLAPDGKRGIELATRHLPDLILCDVMMPELDGFGVLKIIRANDRTQNIPFIFLTAKSEKEDFRKGMGLGADDYIAKPFDDVDMLRTIEMRLQRSEHIKHQFEVPGSGLARKVDKKELVKRVIEGQDVKIWNAGYTLYSPGEKGRDVYYVKSGSLKESMDNDFGKSLIIDFYFGGEFVGIEDIFTGNYRSTELSAFEDSKVVRISKEHFLQFVGQDSEIAGLIMSTLADRLQKTKRDMLSYAYASVRNTHHL